jgi:hypothetical protein
VLCRPWHIRYAAITGQRTNINSIIILSPDDAM